MKPSGIQSKTPVSIVHPIAPTFDASSRVLILGSFPSVKSRETGYFYGHPQNRFWKVLAALYDEPVPGTVADRKTFVLHHDIALWDVIASCTITGSSDASIKNAVPNDLSVIFRTASIQKVFVNGKTAYTLYNRYLLSSTGIPAQALPSTSPANAAWQLPALIEAWRVIL